MAMVFDVSFDKEEIEQLYLTYKNNRPNYNKIKTELFGDGAKRAFQNNLRGRVYFIIALTAIAIASSVFSFFAQHWSSMAAIWVIWAGFTIVLLIAMYLSYRDSYLVLKRNESFFERFEKVAEQAETLDDFIIDWNLSEQTAPSSKTKLASKIK